jgi:predicted Zn-dependent protease
MAHALREHGREQASQQAVQQGLISLGGALLGVGSGGQQLASIVTDVTFNLPHSRQDETEADRIGVELAARAGYDPRAAITLWQKMGQVGGGAPPQFLSTHPAPANRQADLTSYSARVLPLYEAARKR